MMMMMMMILDLLELEVMMPFASTRTLSPWNPAILPKEKGLEEGISISLLADDDDDDDDSAAYP